MNESYLHFSFFLFTINNSHFFPSLNIRHSSMHIDEYKIIRIVHRNKTIDYLFSSTDTKLALKMKAPFYICFLWFSNDLRLFYYFSYEMTVVWFRRYR